MNATVLKFLGIMAAGGVCGALLGWVGKCSTGSCPFTANPWRGGLFGAIVGAVFAAALLLQSGGAGSTASAAETALPHVADEAGFRQAVLDAKGLVLVDFYADWCPPCRKLGPVLAELATEESGKVAVVKVNVDKAKALAQEYQVRSIPHLVLFRAGEVVGARSGYQAKAELLAWLRPLYPQAPAAAAPAGAPPPEAP